MTHRRDAETLGARGRPFDDFAKVRWLADVVGERVAAEIVEMHFATIRSQLSSADVAHLYDERYISRLRGHPVAVVVQEHFPVNIFQAPVLRHILDGYSARRERVLDIGCGPGDFAIALSSLGFECVGLDYTPSLIELARQSAAENLERFRVEPRFVLGDFAALAAYERFHAVTLNDVVEHVSGSELLELLRECRARLLPGGRVFVHTPNGRCFYNWTERTLKGRLLNFLVRHFSRRRVHKTLEEVYYEQVHINVMGITALRAVAHEAGFRRVQVSYDDRFRLPWLNDVFSGSMTVVLE